MQSHKTEKSEKSVKTSTETKAVLDLAKRAKAASRELARVKHEKTCCYLAYDREQNRAGIIKDTRGEPCRPGEYGKGKGTRFRCA